MASSSTADGDQFKEYTISANNITAKFIPNGARLMSLLVPDRSGNLQDVVFGYDNLKGCRGDKPQAKTSGSDLKNFHDRDISKFARSGQASPWNGLLVYLFIWKGVTRPYSTD
ncbi:galactose mutarotase-like protein [Penicillium subrubescens]|uniref:galactose mutarotase-like protein n=1 Tax=Penicillium subrubescens TaxID=1316194 RepID=UPI002545AAC5|nr:galactose mutarotase-like protein [Penicillium subrubescens]KAJ5896701.1 galactose mutarotase-like protein [Penicillium subrubescens]